MFKRILVGIDGSDHALEAAKLSGEMARLTKADLWVVVCYDPLPAYLGQPLMQQAIDTRIEFTEEILKPAVEAIGKIPGGLRTEVLEGPPAEAILNVADAREIDLIVMGTRGLGRLAGAILGSQSQKVVAHASCPVLLVR
jgi:nucleotide-binding universal stress UspA family protein